MNKLFLFLSFLLYVNSFSQTKVSGIVYDDLNQTLPFANIYFKGEKTGVSSDENGKFNIESAKDYTSIIVKYAGFADKEVTLQTSTTTNLKIKMTSGQELQEVVVVGKPKKHLDKKENPAYKILQGIWKNKKKSGLSLAKKYQYSRFTSISEGLSNLDSVFLKRLLSKEYDSVIKIAQQDRKQKTFNIPVYLNEKNEKIYGDNILKKERVDIEGERTTGVVQTGYALDKISSLIKTTDIYEDDIVIFNKPFVSPISTRGYGSYEYVLQDSIQEDNKKYYEIFFFPRNSQDLLFEGNFKVESKSFSITEIFLRNNRKMNMNFVRNLFIDKTFTLVNDSIYLPLKDSYEGDFTVLSKDDDERGLYIKKNILYADYEFEQAKGSEFYDQQIIQTKSNQFKKDDEYWKSIDNREAGLNNTRKIIADLGSNKRISTVTNLITVLSSGHFKLFNNIQFGPFWQSVSNNNIEGIRLKAGIRTFKTSNDLFRAKTYIAYGTKDKLFKFGIEGKYLFNHQPRMTIGALVLRDNLQLSGIGLEESELAPINVNTNVIIARGENFSLTKEKKELISYDISFTKNLKLSVAGIHRNMRSAQEDFFSIAYQLPGAIEKNVITDFSTSFILAFNPKRDVYGFGVEQVTGNNLFSTLILKYTKGYKGVLGGDFNYNKLQFSYKKLFLVSNLGIFKVGVDAAKVFETVPLTLLTPVVANQSFSIQPNAFSLIDFYDFTTDQYLAGQFEHHFNGLITNRIPLIKKLKIRELIFYKAVTGDISNENIAINRSSIVYNAPNKKIYSEYGFGFENIGLGNFRPIRIDFVWRTQFNNRNGLVPPSFGIRMGLFPEF
jgi:hypothetical protein